MISAMKPAVILRCGATLFVVALCGLGMARPAGREVLDQIVTICDNHEFRLLVDLHTPEPGGQPAPSLDIKGWRHNDTARPVLLRAGQDVRVTGVFNYGDRSRGVRRRFSRILWAYV